MHHPHLKYIQVYEHDHLRIGDERYGCTFTEQHWRALLRINEYQYPPFFKILHRGVQFTHFVGCVHAGDLCIEILPKTDRLDGQNNRAMLLQMLQACRKIPALPVNSLLASRPGSLNDYFIRFFLLEVEKLLCQGLNRQYSQKAENLHHYKGRMLVAEQLRHNYIHKERSYCAHEVLDNEHLLHAIIAAALRLSANLSTSQELIQYSKKLSGYFPETITIREGTQEAKKYKLKRHEARYESSLRWSLLLLEQLRPQMTSGLLSTSFFLIDMQRLFEEFVTLCIEKAAPKMGCKLLIQPSIQFWKERKIRPDMLLQTPEGENIIVDAKWKLLKNGQPEESDLKQMYIYNQFFEAKRAFLLYPAQNRQSETGAFYQRDTSHPKQCAMYFVPLIDSHSGKLNIRVGEELVAHLLDAYVQ